MGRLGWLCVLVAGCSAPTHHVVQPVQAVCHMTAILESTDGSGGIFPRGRGVFLDASTVLAPASVVGDARTLRVTRRFGFSGEDSRDLRVEARLARTFRADADADLALLVLVVPQGFWCDEALALSPTPLESNETVFAFDPELGRVIAGSAIPEGIDPLTSRLYVYPGEFSGLVSIGSAVGAPIFVQRDGRFELAGLIQEVGKYGNRIIPADEIRRFLDTVTR